MEEKKKYRYKCIIFNIRPSDHAEIKSRAYDKGMTMTKWILKAIATQIRKEMDLE